MKVDISMSNYAQGDTVNIQASNENKPSNKFDVKEVAAIGVNLPQYFEQNPQERPSVGEEAFIQAVEKANKILEGVSTEVKFTVHERTKQISVKVINKETQEVIREVPPEKILDMVADMCIKAGIWVDEKR